MPYKDKIATHCLFSLAQYLTTARALLFNILWKRKYFLFVSIQLSCRIVMIPQLALDLCPPPCRAAGRVSSLGSQGDCGSTKPHSQLPSHQQALATYSSSILKSFSSTQSLPHSLIPPGGKPSPTVTGDRSLLSRKGFDFCRRINSN